MAWLREGVPFIVHKGTGVLNEQGYRRSTMKWQEEIQWAASNANGKNAKATMYWATIDACAYFIWQERNTRVFQQKQRSHEQITMLIIQEVACQSNLSLKLASRMRELNFP
ncbi:hypothetical protein HAX54_017815 [Datura stramonium]|uniref:Reverse transcriptase zinc-binding domain-containing protein n=1 Tax=Datura stramonium TaxID=4076 RepID=A0ABS8Y8A9_DATST|nr:hypothetical protein [Datura stramonium]